MAKKKNTTKILTKPKQKGITEISPSKTLKSFAHSTEELVREVPQREVQEDRRSLFFKEEFKSEQAGVNKWLG